MKLKIIKGPGDGDVALQSLALSAAVVGNRSRVFQLPGVTHSSIVGDGAGAELGLAAMFAAITGDTASIDKHSLAATSA